MINFAFYASLLFTALSAAAIYLITKKRINSTAISAELAKKKYLPLVLTLGTLSGLVIFPTFVSILNYLGLPSSYGHGEILIADIVFNLLFSLIIGIVGRVVLSWKPMQW